MNRPIAEKAVIDTAAQVFRESERARWAIAQPQKIAGTWAPVMTEQQKQEHDEYVIKHNLPF